MILKKRIAHEHSEGAGHGVEVKSDKIQYENSKGQKLLGDEKMD